MEADLENYGWPYWWVAAWAQQKPVGNMLSPGDTIIITALQLVLEYVKQY